MVVAAVLIALGTGLIVVTLSRSGTSSLVPSVALTPAQAFSFSWETIGGCREARLDHGIDHDPSGYSDQEHDECVPGQPLPPLAGGVTGP